MLRFHNIITRSVFIPFTRSNGLYPVHVNLAASHVIQNDCGRNSSAISSSHTYICVLSFTCMFVCLLWWIDSSSIYLIHWRPCKLTARVLHGAALDCYGHNSVSDALNDVLGRHIPLYFLGQDVPLYFLGQAGSLERRTCVIPSRYSIAPGIRNAFLKVPTESG